MKTLNLVLPIFATLALTASSALAGGYGDDGGYGGDTGYQSKLLYATGNFKSSSFADGYGALTESRTGAGGMIDVGSIYEGAYDSCDGDCPPNVQKRQDYAVMNAWADAYQRSENTNGASFSEACGDATVEAFFGELMPERH